MFTQTELLKMITVGDKNYGSFKIFVKVTNKLGLKIAGVESLRDQNYERQELASRVGLGPDVYGKFDFMYNGQLVFGYYTEVVETYNRNNKDFFNSERMDQLRADLIDKIGFKCFDIKQNNVGIKNGVMVLIDFDCEDAWRCKNFHHFDLTSL